MFRGKKVMIMADTPQPSVTALAVPAGRPGTFAKGFDPRRSTLEQRSAAVHMRGSRRSLAMALRERVPSEVIAEWLYRAAFDSIDPRTEYDEQGLVVKGYPPLSFDQSLKCMLIILERRDGAPAQKVVLEEDIRRTIAETESKPDYSTLSGEELETLRTLTRKAVEASRARKVKP